MAEKRVTSCPGDVIRFDDYSMLDHDGATWAWSFPGGTPSSSTERTPAVTYGGPGLYNVTLTVTNAIGSSTRTVLGMIEVLDPVINEVPPPIDFATDDNFTVINPDGGVTWTPTEITSCDPEGNTAYFVDNYIYSSYGVDEILLPVNIDLAGIESATLRFDVAYAPYYDGNFFIDSLHVVVSADCGRTEDFLFRSGGAELSTTTSGIGPDNLYEYDVFRPQSCDEWRTVELDLSAYSGRYITIRFRNRSGYGNNMYLDNIIVDALYTSTTDPDAQVAFTLYPNPTTSTTLLAGSSEGPVTVSVHTPEGIAIEHRKVSNGGSWSEQISLDRFAPGIYLVTVTDARGNARTEKLTKL
jgi:PKD repeat protein